MKLKDIISKNNGYTTKEMGCAIGGCAALVVGGMILEYALLGTIGWNVIKKHVVYEDRYFDALRIADKNSDGDLNQEESKAFFDELGVVRIIDIPNPNSPSKTAFAPQRSVDLRPSYDSLTKYLDARKK